MVASTVLNKPIFFSGLLLITNLLFSCAPSSHVAVFERPTVSSQMETERLGGQRIHIIKSGDTLYSIAFSNGLNVNTLAAWNSVTDTGKLAIGQRIRLTKPREFAANKEIVINKKNLSKNNTDQNSVSHTVITPKRTSQESFSHRDTKWSWPTKGKVTKLFAPNLGQQGIDLRGKFGQMIITADEGEVVYVGNGLKGYGNLIIIKHSQQFLSAYAHNRKIFVKEGQNIKAQTKIATMGTDKNKVSTLHFQIRKNGKPVDPLKYLPR